MQAQSRIKPCPVSHRGLAVGKAKLPSSPGLLGPGPLCPRPCHPTGMRMTPVTSLYPSWAGGWAHGREDRAWWRSGRGRVRDESVTVADVRGGSIIQVIRLEPPGGGGGPAAARMVSWPGRGGAAGPWELSPLTDGWGQLPVASHPRHEPRGHLCDRPRWPPAQRLALNVHKAFCSRSRGWACSDEGPLSEEGAACWGFPLPSTPTAFL